MRFLQSNLREPGEVAGEFLETQRGAVAGVAEHDGLELETVIHRQHGHIVIHGALEGIGGDELGDITVRLVLAAVHAKARDADAVLERGGREVFQGRAGDIQNLRFQAGGIFLDSLDAFGVERIDIVQSSAQHRAGVRVRCVDHDLRRLQIMRLGQLGFQAGIKTGGHAEGVGGNDHRPAALGIFQRERLGPERMQHAVTGSGASAIAGHPDGFARGDVHLGRAGFPSGGDEGRGAQQQDKQKAQGGHGARVVFDGQLSRPKGAALFSTDN